MDCGWLRVAQPQFSNGGRLPPPAEAEWFLPPSIMKGVLGCGLIVDVLIGISDLFGYS